MYQSIVLRFRDEWFISISNVISYLCYRQGDTWFKKFENFISFYFVILNRFNIIYNGKYLKVLLGGRDGRCCF